MDVTINGNLAIDNLLFVDLISVNIFSFHLLISSIISLVGIGLASCWKDDKRCEAYFIMLYLRAAFWIITFVSVSINYSVKIEIEWGGIISDL